MSLCPICGRVYCDHSSEERGQTDEEMMEKLTEEEYSVWETEPGDSQRKIEIAIKVRDQQRLRRKDKIKIEMKNYLVDFQKISWESPLTGGIRYKIFNSDNKKLKLVEFSDNFIEDDWCTKRHIGYLIDGSMSIDFNGKLVKFKSGDGLFIPGGNESKHKAVMEKGEKALLILFEDY